MSVNLLETIKQQAAALTAQEKSQLANYLLAQATPEPQSDAASGETENDLRRKRLEWIKAHREEFAGQYIALAGDQLVGAGRTIREAQEQAEEKGINHPYLVRMTSEHATLSAGW